MTPEGKGRSPGYYTWKRLRRNHTAFISLIFICLCFLVAVLGYTILPDKSPDANSQLLELETIPPGTTVTILKIHKPRAEKKTSPLEVMISGRAENYTERPISSYKINGANLTIIPYGLNEKYAETYTLPEILFPLPPEDKSVWIRGESVSFKDYDGHERSANTKVLTEEIKKNNIIRRTYWLGADRFGRDMLSRLLLGTRVSVSVGFISVAISLLIGITLGALAGFFRGWVDHLIMWLINVIWSVPTFLLVMAVSLVLGRGFWQVFIAVGFTMWVDCARLVRGQIFAAREFEYVQSARALGYQSGRIIVRHILPNILGPIMVIAAANFASAILLEAGLSFLGLGVQPPMPSWGVMISENYGAILMNSAHLAILPGAAIMLLVLAFNLLGSGFRDAIDVRMK